MPAPRHPSAVLPLPFCCSAAASFCFRFPCLWRSVHRPRTPAPPQFALAEADRCFEAGEMWLAIKLCELGMKFYSVGHTAPLFAPPLLCLSTAALRYKTALFLDKVLLGRTHGAAFCSAFALPLCAVRQRLSLAVHRSTTAVRSETS